MRIHQIRLTNFRNFSDAVVTFGERRNLILGRNAQGKTNLLEAIHILGVGRSHRERREANLVKFGETFYRIEGVFFDKSVRNVIEVAYSEQRKRIRINAKEARPVDLIGFAGVVISSPEDIALVKGAPGVRRLFLDVAISQIRREYLRSLQRYVRVLDQRNKLLKQAQLSGQMPSDISVWNTKLVEIGAAIVRLRLEYLEEIEKDVESNFQKISRTRGKVGLIYKPKGYDVDSDVDSLEAVESLMADALTSLLEAEVRRGYTLIGPHVDDFCFKVDGRDLRLFGSEGEQRTAVLAIRCAEAQEMKAKRGAPIVLLDDVFAELDDERSRALTALISEFDQIILTSSRGVSLGDEAARIIEISDGRIVRNG